MDRETRNLINSKQDLLVNSSNLSFSRMADGQISVGNKAGELLALILKKGGKLWKIYLSSDGNQKVDKNIYIGGDSYTSGTVWGNQIYMIAHNFTSTTNAKVYLEFNRSQSSTSLHSYNKFTAPYDGRLIKVEARSETAGGSTVMGLHIATDGTENPSTTPLESITENMASANTAYEFKFTGISKFNKGDVLAVSIDSTDNLHDTNITTVWSFNIRK